MGGTMQIVSEARMMRVYHWQDIDQRYRSLPDADNLWITQPSYDPQPKERRPVDELPGDVTDSLSRLAALERIPRTQHQVTSSAARHATHRAH
jgi:hypothetical protein